MSDTVYAAYMYSYPHKTAYRTFDKPIDIKPFVESQGAKSAALYFHIPFCRHKCGYCNLFSQQTCHNERMTAYLDAMNREAKHLSAITRNLTFDSFSIGGGTPLILDLPKVKQLFHIASLFGVNPQQTPTSVETSPDYADFNTLSCLKDIGVERLSIGIQSFDDSELRRIGRAAMSATCRKALDAITTIGFHTLNIDLIYGIEGQTPENILYSIREALTYQPDELFIYPLYVRQGTRINSRAADSDITAMYRVARQKLLDAGFTQTSMRRFTKHPKTDAEFSCGDEIMISCGCGGRNYVGDLHFSTPYAIRQASIAGIIDAYIRAADYTKATHGYLLNSEEQQRRFIIKNLMYHRGIDKSEFAHRFDRSLSDYQQFEKMSARGFITDDGNRIRLTESGMEHSDEVGEWFVSRMVREKMENL
ncbi:MAG: STM4012 family radical SAM protein [Bacteroidales bacterium]|jgi:oxygen-independent coproporphyrinogen-3 oxidase|nr:STM4012 family radical SAM protein [Bacteroidales bacterium]